MKRTGRLIIMTLLTVALLESVNMALAHYETCQAMPSSDTSGCDSICVSGVCKNFTYAPACGSCAMDESYWDNCSSTNFTSQCTVQNAFCVPGGHLGAGADICECGVVGGSLPPYAVACGCTP